jgi:hypothetical protein
MASEGCSGHGNSTSRNLQQSGTDPASTSRLTTLQLPDPVASVETNDVR